VASAVAAVPCSRWRREILGNGMGSLLVLVRTS
jgi:hypothetical protein